MGREPAHAAEALDAIEEPQSAEASPAMQDLVLIGAPARLGGASLGTVAVIAPTRIQYQEMIQAVSYIAGLSERILETDLN